MCAEKFNHLCSSVAHEKKQRLKCCSGDGRGSSRRSQHAGDAELSCAAAAAAAGV